MPRAKKESVNFSCKLAIDICKKLEEYCRISGMSKTAVVEKAVERYVDGNMTVMREIASKKGT